MVTLSEVTFAWSRKWQPIPIFLPGHSHGQRGFVGRSPWGHKESDTTEANEQAHTWASCVLTRVSLGLPQGRGEVWDQRPLLWRWRGHSHRPLQHLVLTPWGGAAQGSLGDPERAFQERETQTRPSRNEAHGISGPDCSHLPF